MPAPLILRIIGDAVSYLRTADSTIAANAKLAASFGGIGTEARLSADAQIAASVKARTVMEGNLVALQAAQAKTVAGSREQVAANLLVADAQAKLNRSLGITTISTARTGQTARTAENDLNKLARGVLSGSGAVGALGRSLAFASTGFIAVASGAIVLRSAISAALQLAATQRQVAAQLKTSGKTWDEYGARVDAVDLRLSHISGYTNQELLQSFGYLVRVNGNVSTALRLNATAADVARGRHIALSAAAIALAKALGGSSTALKRLGITIPANVKGMDALNYVSAKFAGQAKAGATVSDRFHASLVDTGEIIGTALLPAFDRLTTRLSDWLAKANQSGRIQRDTNEAVKIGGDVFHTLGTVIGTVDKVTGSFANTIKALVTLKIASIMAGWISNLETLAVRWQAVTVAAKDATAAETLAVGGGTLVGAGAAGAAVKGREAAATKTALDRSLGAGVETSVSTGLAAGVAAGAGMAATKLGGLKASLASLASKPIAIAIALTFIPPSKGGQSFLDKLGLGTLGRLPLVGPLDQEIARFIHSQYPFQGNPPGPITPDKTFSLLGQKFAFGTSQAYQALTTAGAKLPAIANTTAKQELKAAEDLNKAAQKSSVAAKRVELSIQQINDQNAAIAQASPSLNLRYRKSGPVPTIFSGPGVPTIGTPQQQPPKTSPVTPSNFGGLKPITVWASYQLTIAEQIAQAQAALTTSTNDDVAVAKQIIARIKRLIDAGHLQGKSLIEALQAEAGALGTVQQAQDAAKAAAQQRAAAAKARAAAAKAAAESYSIPMNLQIAQARLEAYGKDTSAVLKKIIAAAQRAIASGKKSGAGLVAAYGVIAAAQSQLSQQATSFAMPLKLQLQLAKAQAVGGDQTKILQRMKAALERALKKAKGNIQQQIDIWNQISSINQQLGSSTNTAYGDFKQAALKALTANAGLTAAQRRLLEQRYSRVGPGGTIPTGGTTAGGFIIDPATGRPIHRTTSHQARRGGSGYTAATGRPLPIRIINDLNVYIDGHHVEAAVTSRQQRHRRRNPASRRGPNAATAAA